MNFLDQSRSWCFGENSNFNLNSQFYENESLSVKCLICRGRHGPNHVTENCPEERIQQILAHRQNQWDNQDDLPFQQRQECFPSYEYASHSEPSCVDSSWNSSGFNSWEKLERRLTDLEDMLSTHQTFKKDTELVLEQNLEHILALQQAKLSSDKIIEEQAKKIKVLEATVERMEFQLNSLHKWHKKKSEECSDRFEMAQISINHLKDKWAEIDRIMCFQFGGNWSSCNRVSSQYEDSSDDEEFWTEKPTTSTPLVPEKKVEPECKKEGIEKVVYLGSINVVEPSSTVLKNEDLKASPSSMEHDKKIHDKRHRKGWIPSPSPSKVETDMWEEGDIFGVLFDNSSSVDVHEETHVPKTETSCGRCGLSCVKQLRACVNMINVKPTMSKVKEREVRALKSKKNSKLERV